MRNIKISDTIVLTERERATVAAIIGRFGGRIGSVSVYGSRAMGNSRAASDLDLVLYPPLSRRDLYDLMDAFEESDLPINVDLVEWEAITSEPLRRQIEQHSVPLWEAVTIGG